MKIVITALLALTALGGCARFPPVTSSAGNDYPSAAPRERSSEDCRGVYDQLGKACIGG
jgi:hypothetical protein